MGNSYTYDKDSEKELILEAVSEYFYSLIENGNYYPFEFSEDAERAHEVAEYIVERLEGLLDEQWH